MTKAGPNSINVSTAFRQWDLACKIFPSVMNISFLSLRSQNVSAGFHSRERLRLRLVLGPYFDELELSLVPLPVYLDLLSSPVSHGAGRELLFREADVGDLLRPFIQFDSRHALGERPTLVKVCP